MEEARGYFDEAKLLDMMAKTEVNERRRGVLLVNQVLVMLLTAKFSVLRVLDPLRTNGSQVRRP